MSQIGDVESAIDQFTNLMLVVGGENWVFLRTGLDPTNPYRWVTVQSILLTNFLARDVLFKGTADSTASDGRILKGQKGGIHWLTAYSLSAVSGDNPPPNTRFVWTRVPGGEFQRYPTIWATGVRQWDFDYRDLLLPQDNPRGPSKKTRQRHKLPERPIV